MQEVPLVKEHFPSQYNTTCSTFLREDGSNVLKLNQHYLEGGKLYSFVLTWTSGRQVLRLICRFSFKCYDLFINSWLEEWQLFVLWVCLNAYSMYGYGLWAFRGGCRRCLITVTICSWADAGSFIELWTGKDCLRDLLEPGLHLTPSCTVLNPAPDKEAAGGSPRRQRRAASFMAVLRVQASLSARPGPGLSKPFAVKRPEEDWEPLPFHSSKPYICFFLLSLPDSLSFSSLCPSPCLIPSFFSQQWVKCGLVSQPAVPSHFLSSLVFHHIPLFLPVPFSAAVSHSCSFSASFPSSDYCSDTAYPAVISLITFKQLSVAFSPSIGPPSPFSFSNCLLFSPPVSRRKRFSLSNNKTQILIQCIHFFFFFTTDGFYTCRLNFAGRYAAVCIHANEENSHKTKKDRITYVHKYVAHYLFIHLSHHSFFFADDLTLCIGFVIAKPSIFFQEANYPVERVP